MRRPGGCGVRIVQRAVTRRTQATIGALKSLGEADLKPMLRV
jgi:hypothetical protein